MSGYDLVDTHCHLNFPDLFPDPDGEVTFAADAGVRRLIVVGCDRETSAGAVALAERHSGVYAVVGWHPNYASRFDKDELAVLRDWLAHPNVVALGEIGLDYHWDHATRDEQRTALECQLRLGEELGCPIVFHCREAYDDLLDVLAQREGGPYLLHCFGGDERQAARSAEIGCWFGVDGPLTYKNASSLRQVVSGLPTDRIVVETDAPYLTPHPYRGKSNRPAYVTLVNAALAQTLSLGVAECAALTTANAERFFGIAS